MLSCLLFSSFLTPKVLPSPKKCQFDGFHILFRLGFLIDFLSHAAIVGFMGGAAVTITLQQLKGFLGIKNFTKKSDIVSVMNSVFKAARHGVNIFSFSLFLLFSNSSFFDHFLLNRNPVIQYSAYIEPMLLSLM